MYWIWVDTKFRCTQCIRIQIIGNIYIIKIQSISPVAFISKGYDYFVMSNEIVEIYIFGSPFI
jgi:hypothetical protein